MIGGIVFTTNISIHALLAESDLEIPLHCLVIHNFYPRSPCGERPLAPKQNPTQQRISIHALLAESDIFGLCEGVFLLHFYPRSPCGERQYVQ